MESRINENNRTEGKQKRINQLTPFKRAAISMVMGLAFLLGCSWMLLNVFSSSMIKSVTEVPERNMVEEYELAAENFKSKALEGIYTIRKVYMIPESQITAPVPDANAFGTTNNMADLVPIVAKAEEYGLVKAEDVVALAETTKWTDEVPIQYYLDESIMAIAWKAKMGNDVYNFTEVVIGHPSQFRKYLTDNKYASIKRKTVTVMSQELNAVFGMSADYYAYRGVGAVVYNGNVYRKNMGYLDHCFVDSSGNLHVEGRKNVPGEQLEQYVKDNDIRFSLAFGPILVENGEVSYYAGRDYMIGQPLLNYSRAALGQLGDLHYLIMVVDGGATSLGQIRDGTTILTFAEQVQKMGVINAYTLDGGQTATMAFNGKLFNKVGYGSERPISDLIFFATAKPEGRETEVVE